MSLTTVYDSIAADQIPANAQGAAGYVGPFRPDNRFVDYLAIVARFPVLAARGRVVSIAAHPDLIAEYLDMENGDARAEDFPAWHARMVEHGIWNPGGYTFRANESHWEDVCHRAAIPRSRRRKWMADWRGFPFLEPDDDGCQYTDRAVAGHDDDATLARDSFFRPEGHPDPHGLFHGALVFDSANGRWHVQSRTGTNVKLGGPDQWDSVQVQLNPSNGEWRDHPMPLNAPPLGGK